ncbi:hypothetical protein FA13DRAFT_1726279, partial [Coprinellus micaceus]
HPIFLFLTYSVPTVPHSSPWGSKGYHWVQAQAVHVCRYWRSASIDCADLWARLDFEQPADKTLSQVNRIRSLTIADGGIANNALCDLAVAILRSPEWAGDASILQGIDIDYSSCLYV